MQCIEKINAYLKSMDSSITPFSLLKEMHIEYLLDITQKLEAYIEEKNISFVYGKGRRKHELQRLYDELENHAIHLWKYAIQLDIFGKRNSFSKTDPDATFMHMKYDYYNHTGVFKPGYNVQMGVSDGYIRHLYISGDCNDMRTYIPFMESYKRAYGRLPTKTPTDAGYGSYDAYSYAKLNGIELYMKYPMMKKKQEKVSEKTKFKSYTFQRNENNEVLCPAGHSFQTIKYTQDKRSQYPRINELTATGKCHDCSLRTQCTTSKKGRSMIRNRQLEKYQEEVDRNVMSEAGIEIMKQRSIQAEGVFGIIKQDQGYTRLRRRGESGVNLEIYLVAIGHNLRKYQKFKLLMKANQRTRAS